jgi:hypothetical protein
LLPLQQLGCSDSMQAGGRWASIARPTHRSGSCREAGATASYRGDKSTLETTRKTTESPLG